MAKRAGLSSVAIRCVAACLLLLGVDLPASSILAQTAEPAPEPTGTPYGPVELILLRSTLIAINQANATGDYNVLKALIAPDTSRSLSLERLASIFRPWRDKRRDVAFAIIAEPVFKASGVQGSGGELWLAGTVRTPGFPLEFDFAFRKVADRWLLIRFAIGDGAIHVSSAQPPETSRSTDKKSAGGQTVSADPPAIHPPLPPDRPWY